MGTVVHDSIDTFIKTGDVPKFEDLFYPLVEAQLAIDPNFNEWLSAGSGDNKIQGKAVVDLGKLCIDNALLFLKDFDVWESEYPIITQLPGCEVDVKAYIDIVGEHKNLGPLIVDWKSGKTKPKTPLQLQVYEALLDQPWEGALVHPFPTDKLNGYWGMLHPDAKPKTERGRFVDLSGVDPAVIGARFQKAYEGMKKKVYAGQLKYSCQFCFQQDNCKINAGETQRARYYDLAETEGYPF